MARDVAEIAVRRQHREIMAQAELRQERVDGADLRARPTTAIAQLGGLNMVPSVRRDKRQGREPIENLRSRLGSGESLQQLLQDQTGCQNHVLAVQSAPQGGGLRRLRWAIPAEREGPHAGVNEEVQSRLRARL